MGKLFPKTKKTNRKALIASPDGSRMGRKRHGEYKKKKTAVKEAVVRLQEMYTRGARPRKT